MTTRSSTSVKARLLQRLRPSPEASSGKELPCLALNQADCRLSSLLKRGQELAGDHPCFGARRLPSAARVIAATAFLVKHFDVVASASL